MLSVTHTCPWAEPEPQLLLWWPFHGYPGVWGGQGQGSSVVGAAQLSLHQAGGISAGIN